MAAASRTAYQRFLLEHDDLSLDDLMDLPEMAGKNRESMERIRRRVRQYEREGSPAEQRQSRVNKIDRLLERSGIDLDDVARIEKVRLNEWQGLIKNANDEAEIVDLEASSIILTPVWAEGPTWPVIQQAPPIQVRPLPPTPKMPRLGGFKIAVLLTDPQIGYFRDARDQLHPTHDESALDIAMQVLRLTQPDRAIFLGDNLDLPELGKYRVEAAFVRTTQPAINRAAQLMAEAREHVGDDAELEWLEGNHEKRLPNHIKDNAAASFGLRRANAPDSWPVMSVPYLCRADEYGVNYIPGYPANELWLNDRLLVFHGDKAAAGVNAAAYLNDERVSVLYAHIHRREHVERTKRVRGGHRTYLAACPGCLCRTDGVVPSTKGGHDLDGVPIRRQENWQQGLAVVTYLPDDGMFFYEPVPIFDGVAMFRGQLLTARCDVEGRKVA